MGSRWKPGDRVLIQLVNGDGLTYTYQMATLEKKSVSWGDQWDFRLDGVDYTGRRLSFCVERWIHEPPILDKLAAL